MGATRLLRWSFFKEDLFELNLKWMTSNFMKNLMEKISLPWIKIFLRLWFYFWFISDSCDKKEPSLPLIHMLKLQYTTNLLSHHIIVLEESRVRHNHMFHNKFFFFIHHKMLPIQNQPIYKPPLIIEIITWIMMIF